MYFHTSFSKQSIMNETALVGEGINWSTRKKLIVPAANDCIHVRVSSPTCQIHFYTFIVFASYILKHISFLFSPHIYSSYSIIFFPLFCLLSSVFFFIYSPFTWGLSLFLLIHLLTMLMSNTVFLYTSINFLLEKVCSTFFLQKQKFYDISLLFRCIQIGSHFKKGLWVEKNKISKMFHSVLFRQFMV